MIHSSISLILDHLSAVERWCDDWEEGCGVSDSGLISLYVRALSVGFVCYAWLVSVSMPRLAVRFDSLERGSDWQGMGWINRLGWSIRYNCLVYRVVHCDYTLRFLMAHCADRWTDCRFVLDYYIDANMLASFGKIMKLFRFKFFSPSSLLL